MIYLSKISGAMGAERKMGGGTMPPPITFEESICLLVVIQKITGW